MGIWIETDSVLRIRILGECIGDLSLIDIQTTRSAFIRSNQDDLSQYSTMMISYS